MPPLSPITRRTFRVGPFSRGLALKWWSNPQSLADTNDSTPYVMNMDYVGEEWRTRVGLKFNSVLSGLIASHIGTYQTLLGNPGKRLAILGQITASSPTASTLKIVTYNGTATATQTITLTAAAAYKVVHYHGLYYLYEKCQTSASGPGSTCGIRVTNTNAPTGTTWTLNGHTAPTADDAFVWKDRVWLIDHINGWIHFSKPTDPTTFSAPDGGSFRPDGSDLERITGVVTQRDIMYIFTINKCYEFYYYNDPNTDGFVKLLYRDFGALEVVEDQDNIYVRNAKGVYLFNNGQIQELSTDLDYYHNIQDLSQKGFDVKTLRTVIINNVMVFPVQFIPYDGYGYDPNSSFKPQAANLALNLETYTWTLYRYCIDISDSPDKPTMDFAWYFQVDTANVSGSKDTYVSPSTPDSAVNSYNGGTAMYYAQDYLPVYQDGWEDAVPGARNANTYGCGIWTPPIQLGSPGINKKLKSVQCMAYTQPNFDSSAVDESQNYLEFLAETNLPFTGSILPLLNPDAFHWNNSLKIVRTGSIGSIPVKPTTDLVPFIASDASDTQGTNVDTPKTFKNLFIGLHFPNLSSVQDHTVKANIRFGFRGFIVDVESSGTDFVPFGNS